MRVILQFVLYRVSFDSRVLSTLGLRVCGLACWVAHLWLKRMVTHWASILCEHSLCVARASLSHCCVILFNRLALLADCRVRAQYRCAVASLLVCVFTDDRADCNGR